MLRSIYLGFHRSVVTPWILPKVFSEARLESAKKGTELLLKMKPLSSPSRRLERVWFHAASVGELESLWPLILLVAQQKSQLILSVLSESAEGALHKLKSELLQMGVEPLFAGYSPWEGQWGSFLDRLQPSLFVTARYEAWPDLWVELSDRKIPLGVVSARDRKSLRIAQKLCRWMGRSLPELYFFTSTTEEASNLKIRFPDATVEFVGDPRWDRVFERAKQGNPRSSAMVQALSDLPRPWGILGSAWSEDLKFLFPQILKRGGTVWIVPHRVDQQSVESIELFLKQQQIPVTRTSHQSPSELRQSSLPGSVILVNEMGFLSELYSAADWAWVGGGFGKGIHSTLEPAIHGIPVGIGPRGAEKFSEVIELTKTGQLTVLSKPADLIRWLQYPVSSERQLAWKKEASARLGAQRRILDRIANSVESQKNAIPFS